MGDAVIALTTNVAINKSMAGEPGYIEFKEEWFDVEERRHPGRQQRGEGIPE